MSLLFGKSEQRAITASSLFSPDWGNESLAGEPVTFSTAIGLDAVAACVGLFSDVIYMLPFHAYRDTGGTPTRLTQAPTLVSSPSLTVDEGVWRTQLLVSLLLWGNAYGLILTRDRFGFPTTVEWLDPQRVSVDEDSTIARNPTFRLDGQVVRPDDLLHVPGRYVRPGSRLGLAPLERFRETFGLAMAARNFGAKWFGDGAHPSSVLSTDQPIPDRATAQTIKDRFMQAVRGKREPVVLGLGLKYEQIQVNPDESQFHETQQAATVAVARAFGVQPEMIAASMSGSSVTYANREQRAIDFLTFSADPWLVRVERFVTRHLPQPQYAQFERGALLRTDLKTRYEAHDIAIRGGWRTPNETREIEDERPLSDGQGDQALWPPYSTSPAPQGASTP